MASLTKISSIITPPRLSRLGVVRLGISLPGGKAKEVGHFIIDAGGELAEQVKNFQGGEPKELDITFYAESIDEIYRSTYQKWKPGKEGPLLLCEGNGESAIEYTGRQRSCPCPQMGKECVRKTVLRFLIPELSLNGYWVMVSKSEHSDRAIRGTLEVALRSGGLLMRPFKLIREAGYASVAGRKVKKYFVKLTIAEPQERKGETERPASADVGALVVPVRGLLQGRVDGQGAEAVGKVANRIMRDRLLEEKRNKVVEKLKLSIRDHRGVAALAVYASVRFRRERFEDLPIEELFELWHDLSKDEVVNEIARLMPVDPGDVLRR